MTTEPVGPRTLGPLPDPTDKWWSPGLNDARWCHPVLGILWGAHEILATDGYFRQAEDLSETLQRMERAFPQLLDATDDQVHVLIHAQREPTPHSAMQDAWDMILKGARDDHFLHALVSIVSTKALGREHALMLTVLTLAEALKSTSERLRDLVKRTPMPPQIL